MKATTEEKEEQLRQNLIARIADECSVIDLDARYDEMLDECYSFKSVGGIFECMSPSRVLKEVDPIAYRCGKNDYEDGEDMAEVDDSYYDRRDVEKVRDEYAGELDTEAEEIEEEIADLEGEEDEANTQTLATLRENLAAKQADAAFMRSLEVW